MPPADHPLLPGWYQRPLPPALVPFSSNRGKQLFKEALARGGGEGYFALAEQFQTQSTPSYCGPGTLAMVLNALALDPKRLWKGNWRWFSEEMLETCDRRKPSTEPLAGVENDGLSFEEFLFLAECNGAHVRAFRASPDGAGHSSVSLSRFRAAIHSATHRTDLHLVASFSRKVLGQTGSGHYSPIGAYHAASDMALVLDVARFKYPPYWAPVPLLWKAVQDIDTATGRGRGYYLMSKAKHSAPSVHAQAMAAHEQAHPADADADGEHEASIFTPLSLACRIAVDKQSWSRLAEHFCSVLPKELQEQEQQGRFHVDPASPAALDTECGLVLSAVLHSLPVELSAIFIMYTHDLSARMVEQYQRNNSNSNGSHKSQQGRGAAAAAQTTAAESAHATALSSPASSCVCDAGCGCNCSMHPVDTSTLSIYHTLLPDHTPHLHSHSIPTVHALHPLLHAIAQTSLFDMIKAANIDLHRLEYKQRRDSSEPASESDNGVSAVASADSSADGGLGFHLLASSSEGELELAALLLLACPQQVFSLLRPAVQSRLEELRRFDALPPVLRTEVSNLRAQMGILAEFCLCGAAPSVHGNDSPNVDPRDVHHNRTHNLQAQRVADALIQQHEQARYMQDNARAATQAETAATAPRSSTASRVPLHRFVSGARTPRKRA